MSVKISNLFDNSNIRQIDSKGSFVVLEHKKDLSINYMNAQAEYFASQMGIHKRQLICQLSDSGVTVQAGAMQWMSGSVNSTTGIKGAGDLAKKIFASKVTNESAIKPEYRGTGFLMLEPTYKHILLIDLKDWNNALNIEDGLFLASEDSNSMKVIAKKTLSSAIAGNEGLFNLCLTGKGIVALESFIPYKELIVVELNNDVIKIDGSYAIAWSDSLQFTVERSGKTLLGSAVSGEGLVNVYRGTGKILMAPI